MKKVIKISIAVFSLFIAGCNSSGKKEEPGYGVQKESTEVKTETASDFRLNKGIGPITSVTLDADVNQKLAEEGKTIYANMCMACHKPDQKFIGPAPKGILERRSPEWVMNMILNPQEMIQKDPIAKKLLMEFNGAPMANQNLTEAQARAVLEYFRTL
ncbi:MAG: cytochrome C [Flavobacteriales bacterium CG_4_9_14_3_um_filter_40_17]|nr:MAG: cytochrome C [Flavobacteriales bacterium CG_4_9_14_3_um_filter_40_17]